MRTLKKITGDTTDTLWQQVSADLSDDNVYEYNVLLVQDGREVELLLDIDPGGGFESGSALTAFSAAVPSEHDFHFALHHQDLIDSAGKFFGMQDVVIGYPEFDKAMIIKTNDRDRMQRIFSEVAVREILQSLRLFSLHLMQHHVAGQKDKLSFLELTIDEGITDPSVLRQLYEAFIRVLKKIDAG